MRYTFNWDGASQEGARAFARIGQRMLDVLCTPAMWIQAWTVNATSPRRYYLAHLHKQKVRAEWIVQQHEDTFISSRPINHFSPTSLWPDSYQWTDGGICVVYGHDTLADMQKVSEARNTIASMAYTGRMVPSQQFLDWLILNHVSVLYPFRDDSDREGVTVIGAYQLPIHTWASQGLIDELQENKV